MFSEIELNVSEPINQQIYRILRNAIITCQVLPGALLSEKEISKQFNVSRQPVRESFIKLAEAGLVNILPQRGTFVTKISIKKVIDGQFIREAVECAIIERVVEQVGAEELQQLRINMEEQKNAVDSNDMERFLEKDDQFHRILIGSIHCSMAWETIENIKAMMDRVRYLTLEEVSPPTTLIMQHENILKSIEERDKEKAVIAQREHLRTILDTIAVIAKQNTTWFVD